MKSCFCDQTSTVYSPFLSLCISVHLTPEMSLKTKLEPYISVHTHKKLNYLSPTLSYKGYGQPLTQWKWNIRSIWPLNEIPNSDRKTDINATASFECLWKGRDYKRYILFNFSYAGIYVNILLTKSWLFALILRRMFALLHCSITCKHLNIILSQTDPLNGIKDGDIRLVIVLLWDNITTFRTSNMSPSGTAWPQLTLQGHPAPCSDQSSPQHWDFS